MELTLTLDLEKSIQCEMDRGHFNSPTEVLQSALSLLREEEERLAVLRSTLNAKLEKSEAALARGEFIDGEAFEAEMDEWRSRVLCRATA